MNVTRAAIDVIEQARGRHSVPGDFGRFVAHDVAGMLAHAELDAISDPTEDGERPLTLVRRTGPLPAA